MIDRRRLLATLPLLAAGPALAATDRFAPLRRLIPHIEHDAGGPLGLALFDSHSGARFAHRGDQRFPLCSTFKLLLAARLLHGAQSGAWRMDDLVPVAASDLYSPSPFTGTRVGGSASLTELAEAMVTVSDNGAANLGLARVGGPAAMTAWLRTMGDRVTRLDRGEPEMNNETPGDPRDTTTPAAMLATCHRLLTAGPLAVAGRAQLAAWMAASQTANAMFRPALPAGWHEANKTGGGEWHARNIVSVITPPGRRPVYVAAFLFAARSSLAERSRHFPLLGRAIVESLA
ncbi:MAG: class A beta-lactamase [Sphingomonadales bacterium]|jgi:beta-lactamase class A